MLKSMTGYGKAEKAFPDKKIIIEIKTLNSKNTDISIKLPVVYKGKEMEMRQVATERLVRGKIDVILSHELNGDTAPAVFNTKVIRNYFRQLSELTNEFGIETGESLLASVLRLPDAVISEQKTTEEEEWKEIMVLFENALGEVEKFRVQEGEAMKKDVESSILSIIEKLGWVKNYEKNRMDRIRERISQSLNELKLSEGVDKNRFEQELIYYLEKLDISEEKNRLENHCRYFLETMDINTPSGKKLGFISQEIGREINTLGSKASDSDIQKLVVEMKDELEKVKELVLNVV